MESDGIQDIILGGGFIFLNFHPENLLMISNLTNIFQVGWNH